MAGTFERLAAALAGRYTIERELGRGGTATVYLALDRRLFRKVAVKVLDPELAAAIGPERFLREIRIAARLEHPNILPLHDSGSADGLLYYVMPYVEGESLRERLEREKHLGLAETVRIVRQVADALDAAHRQGVVHRDVKPENVLLAGERVVVADFGIARAIGGVGGDRLTGTGLAVGTPAYMSPEQAGGEPSLDARGDVYSLGCLTYEMLGGEPPFTGSSAQAILARHAIDPVPPLRTLRPTVTPAVEAAVLGALAKVPADRFATAGAFAEALERAASAGAGPAGRPRANTARVLLAAALAAVALAFALFVLHFAVPPNPHAVGRFAVLPFDVVRASPGQEYFAEGLHEAVIADLADEGLGVIARTSVVRYRHTEKRAREIAHELGVDALVECTLERTADSVTIRSRLVDGRTEQYVWSERFGADAAQASALALEVARGIGQAIAPDRGPASRANSPAPRPVDPEAYDAYLQGRSHLHRPTRADLETSREYFERALAKDPGYAPAWAGISEVWTIGRQRGYYSSQQATPASEAAAYRALALDSTLAEPHYALAEAKFYGEWDWSGADREFRRTLELRPDYAEARAFYAHLLCVLHRPDEAVRQLDRARELDPLDPLVAWIGGAAYTMVGRFDDALSLYRGALERSPDNSSALWVLWVTLASANRTDEAYATVRRWAAASGDSGIAAALERGGRSGGYRGALRAAADYQAAESASHDVGGWKIAVWYATAGEKGKALDWLERAYDEHDPTMPYLDVHPVFRSLHREPRFRALLARMKLPA